MNVKEESKQREEDTVVVGLGASAGGLEPLQHFFRSLPAKTGIAFIVIVHLSPGHKSNLAEILQTRTSLKVVQVNERARIKQDYVYVIPPKKLLAVEGDYIVLSEPDKTTRHATVDLLFNSLGETMNERAVAIILSGSGSDGAEGIKTVKEHGGFIIVQDPEETDFSDMPKNAIHSGLVDMVLPVNSIAKELLQYRTAILQDRFPGEVDEEKEILQKILSKLHSHTGHDFSNYKQSTVLRRIHRRMYVTREGSLTDYYSLLKDSPDEASKLFRNLLISVTRFFRDREAFEALENEIIPELFKAKQPDSQLRIWAAGCATGEEAYSIAILLHEYARRLESEKVPGIQIFATDIDEQAVQIGRRGRYPESIVADMTPERLNRYFDKTGYFYHIKKEISGMVLFAHHDLLKDPPFSKLDMISCRNLLIYLNRDLQSEVLKLFHYALLPEGWLFLGPSDAQIEAVERFKPVNKEFGLYTRGPAPATLPQLPAMPLKVDENRYSSSRLKDWPSQSTQDFEKIQMNFLSGLFGVQSVIVNENHEVIYSTDGIQRYLRYEGGEPSLKILDMVQPELKNSLQSLLFQIKKKESAPSLRKIFTSSESGKKTELQIHRVDNTGFPENCFHVVFREVELWRTPHEERDKTGEDEAMIDTLERELEHAREQVRIVLEKNKASSGKLRASNEELQSMNEELHSTAEELETSLEELHSVNEELKNLNQELERKIDELSRSNSDLKNLMEATEIGILFVDRDFCVKLYTSSINDIFNLIPTDQGRPIEHITHRLQYNSLRNDLTRVLDELDSIKKMVKSRDDRWYSMRLRPYRTIEDKIEGVVVTFLDITQLKEAEERLKQQKQQESLASIGLYALERLEQESIMHRASQQVCMILETDYALLYILDRENDWLHLSAHTGWTMDKDKKRGIENDNKWDAGYALRAREPVVVKNYREENRFRISPLVEDFDVASGLHIKIMGSDDTYGVLSIYSSEKSEFSEYDLNYVQIMANLVGMSIERIEAKKILEETNVQLKKAVRKSEQYQREILNNSIAERWEIGGYLHDNLAQVLASVKIMLADINKHLPDSNEDIKESITALSGIIDEGMSGIRDLTHDIIPVDIEEEGADHAFRFLIRQTQKLHNVNCNLETDEIIGQIKNRKLATNIYHVVQEAIKNAVVHGKAKNIDISATESNGKLILQIKDDGTGFSDIPKSRKGKGLRIMKHRMELLGGTFDTKKRTDSGKKGTVVTCTIPFEDLFHKET